MVLPSLWQDRHPRKPAPPVGPAQVGGTADVCVVGGGLTGLVTALLLGRAGRSVTVLEARQVGFGTTGRSTAKVSVLQGTQLSRIARRQPMSAVTQYVEANREGQAWLGRFCDDHGVPVQRRPAYTYAHTARGRRSVEREHRLARRTGLDTELVDAVPLPFPTSGAVRLDDQLQLDPMDLVEALAAQAAGHGVRIVEGARVLRVTGRSPVRVVTETGTVSASTVVLATLMPILDRGGFFARMAPSRSYGLAFRTPERAVDGMYLSADTPSRSLRDTPPRDGGAGSILLVGGNGHPTGRSGSTYLRLDELRAWTAEHWPGAVETHAWSAQDFTPQHALPYAGPVLPGAEEILVAGGYSKWGFTNGTAAALALSGQILGGHLEWAEVMRPYRAQELRGGLDAFKINGEVGFEMARGWLRPVRHPGMASAPDEGDGYVGYDHLGAPTARSRVDGVERRVSAVCTHLGGIVSWNDAERSWDCPLHGSRFAPDGSVLDAPATCGLRQRP